MIYFVDNWHTKSQGHKKKRSLFRRRRVRPCPAHTTNYVPYKRLYKNNRLGWAELFSFDLCSRMVGPYDSAEITTEHCGTRFFPVFPAWCIESFYPDTIRIKDTIKN